MDNNKQYKVTLPEATIRRIKWLLKINGIQVKEESKSLKNLVFSTRITVTNGRIAGLDLGANGKGMTPEYAFASGYAELMERLQTRLLYDNMLMLPPSASRNILGTSFFRYAPDESMCKAEWRFFPKQCESVKNIHVGRTAYAKIISLRSGKVEQVPLELMRCMTGSTGACAGNTRKEAIVQGICEILERDALQKVFLTDGEGILNIPQSLFNKSYVWDRLINLTHEQGLKFAIKDCSFGIGMPILGLLVWNDTSYQFKIGVATSPEVALSRCFTEIFQGYTGNECLLPKKADMMITSSYNYHRAMINGTGHLPIGVFNEHPIGTLDNFRPYEGKNINGDYKVLTDSLLSLGYEIYIQDCSFLGFPSYYIYIPGLSDVYPQLLDFQKRIDRHIQLMHRAKTMKLPPFNSAYLPGRYPLALYSFAISLKKKNYVLAQRFYEILLGQQLPKTPYYEAIMEFIQLRITGKRIVFIKEQLIEHWGEQIAEKVLFEFGPKADITAIFRLPTCFKCSKCPTESKCALGDLAKLDTIIRKKYCDFCKKHCSQ